MSMPAAETMIGIVATTAIAITAMIVDGIGIGSITTGGIAIGIMIVMIAAAIDGITIGSATKPNREQSARLCCRADDAKI